MLYPQRQKVLGILLIGPIFCLLQPLLYWDILGLLNAEYVVILNTWCALLYIYSMYILLRLEGRYKDVPSYKPNDSRKIPLRWGLSILIGTFVLFLIISGLTNKSMLTMFGFHNMLLLNIVGVNLANEQAQLLKRYPGEITLQTPYQLNHVILWLAANVLVIAVLLIGQVSILWVITALFSNTIVLQTHWIQQSLINPQSHSILDKLPITK
jgi:hypothetical protein